MSGPRSMLDRYLERRAEGFAPRAAAELVAQVYGRHTAEEEARLIATLEALEARRSQEVLTGTTLTIERTADAY